MLFINFLYDLIVNSIGMKLYGWVGSYFNLLIYLILFFSFLFLVIKFLKLKKIACIIIFLTIGFFLVHLVIIPFDRGRQINELIQLGYITVEAINKYEIDNNKLPENLNDLYPEYVNNEEIEEINKYVRYDITDHIKRNKNDQYYKDYVPMEKDMSNVWLKKDILGFELLRYNNKTKQFYLDDK
jgi:uncharacterized protein YebE (UPF0316 family)